MSTRGEGAPAVPLDQAEFASLMAALGPFEQAPWVAVGCSGGADSLCLTLLLADWTRARKGRVTALVVDHGLRPASAAEARQVASWLSSRGIEHNILRRGPGASFRATQAAARELRYALLTEWCATRGFLHLAIGHHLEDQAETVLLRLARGSGVDGLAAMAPIMETPVLRVVRPLLHVPKARLRATLAALEQPYLDDPSNADLRFERVRLRQLAQPLGEAGLSVGALATTAARMASARAALDGASARLLTHAARLHPAGFCLVDRSVLWAAPREIGLRALERILGCISGNNYPPRYTRLVGLYDAFASSAKPSAGRTLGGCRILSWMDTLLICREPRAVTDVQSGGPEFHWDGRFRIRLARPTSTELRCLGTAGWHQVAAARSDLRRTALPAAVKPTLPAFWNLDEVVSVPHLNYGCSTESDLVPQLDTVAFAPVRPLAGARFATSGTAMGA